MLPGAGVLKYVKIGVVSQLLETLCNPRSQQIRMDYSG